MTKEYVMKKQAQDNASNAVATAKSNIESEQYDCFAQTSLEEAIKGWIATWERSGEGHWREFSKPLEAQAEAALVLINNKSRIVNRTLWHRGVLMLLEVAQEVQNLWGTGVSEDGDAWHLTHRGDEGFTLHWSYYDGFNGEFEKADWEICIVGGTVNPVCCWSVEGEHPDFLPKNSRCCAHHTHHDNHAPTKAQGGVDERPARS